MTLALVPAALTRRELEVLREVARGRANKEIARDLKIAAGTIKVHIERILGKLGAVNRAEASTRAIQLGLLDPAAIDFGHGHSRATDRASRAPDGTTRA